MLAFHRKELGILKRGEKGQERIVGLISADRGIRWCDSFQCPFLDRKICLDVDVGLLVLVQTVETLGALR